MSHYTRCPKTQLGTDCLKEILRSCLSVLSTVTALAHNLFQILNSGHLGLTQLHNFCIEAGTLALFLLGDMIQSMKDNFWVTFQEYFSDLIAAKLMCYFSECFERDLQHDRVVFLMFFRKGDYSVPLSETTGYTQGGAGGQTQCFPSCCCPRKSIKIR